MNTSSASKRTYFEFMLKSPLVVWWAGATFAAEMLVSLLPGGAIQVPKVWLVVAVFFVSLSIFVGFIVLYKGWMLYSRAYEAPNILEIARDDEGHVFILESQSKLEIGSVLEIHRMRESAEVSVGFIEVALRRDDGKIQAKPVWIMPVHLRDIETRQLAIQSLTVQPTLSRETLSRWVDQQAEQKVQDLIRRGIEA
jgi:hypothetical protein